MMNFLRQRKRTLGVVICAMEAGRSMIEMIGVLAIVGILSVGAIAGYQKAMMKYKLNKQAEQISSLTINSMTTGSQFTLPPINPGSSSAYNLIPYYKVMNIIPQDMTYSNDSTYIYDTFKNRVQIKYIRWDDSRILYLEFQLFFKKMDHAQCMNILSTIKELHSHIWSFSIVQQNASSSESVSYVYGDEFCTSKNKCLKDLTLVQMRELCDVCVDMTTCRPAWTYNYQIYKK